MSERFIQSIERAADLLELFLLVSPELSIKDISDKTGLSKSTAHGIVKTLEYKGLLQQNPDDLKYKLGMKLFTLGNAVGSRLDIRKIARPLIEERVRDLKETVHLVILDRDEVIYVEKVEGPHSLSIYSQIGKRAPIHCTGVGKAILAFQPREEIERLLDKAELTPFTPKTLTDKRQLMEHLRLVQAQGYAIDDEEIELGLKCVAAPIFNHQGIVIASISCAAPVTRFGDDRVPDVITGVRNTANTISQRMGYQAGSKPLSFSSKSIHQGGE